MDTVIEVEPRTDAGKGAARKLRAAGKVPAVIYAQGDAARHVALSPARLLEIFRKTRNANTVLDLQIDGETVKVLLKEAQRHPVSRAILHVDFYEVGGDRKVEVMVPVTSEGRPVGAISGGRVRLIRRELRVRCRWDKIPEALVVGVEHMDVGDMILASEIPTGDDVEILFDHDFNVVTVVGKRRGNAPIPGDLVDEDEEASEEEGEGAEDGGEDEDGGDADADS